MSSLRLLPVFALPLLLAACGDGNNAGQSTPPAATPPATSAPIPITPAPAPAPAPAPVKPAPAPAPAVAPMGGDAEYLWGRWAATPEMCGSQAVSISQTSFQGAENNCDLSGFTDNGDGSYTANLACTSQGQRNNERLRMTPVFAPTGEGVVLVYPDRSNERVLLLRCAG